VTIESRFRAASIGLVARRWLPVPIGGTLACVTQALKAHVKNGQLVLDDPVTDLPEGAEVELVLVDDNEFEPGEYARLLRAIEEAEEDIERGDYVDGFEFIAQLRARREAANR